MPNSDWQVQLDITAAEVRAEVLAQAQVSKANIDQFKNLSVLRETNASQAYRTDINAARSRSDARIQADSIVGQGQVYGTYLVTGSRTLVVQAVTLAQTEAAGLLSAARIQSAYDIASARVAAEAATQAADLAAAQLLSTVRIAAARTISAAQIAAQQAETAARIDSYSAEYAYRIQVATIIAAARVGATTTETTAQVGARQTVANAQTAAAQTEADARISAERLTTDHRILGVIKTSDAQIQAAQYGADASIYAETKESAASISADQIIAAARISALNLSADKQAADIDAEAKAYASGRELAYRKYSSTSELNSGKYAADRNLAGDVYSANANLSGTIYVSDKEYSGAIDRAAIDLASSQYVAQREIDKSTYSSAADRFRLEAKLTFEGDRYNEVWPYILTVLALVPPQTPGLNTSSVASVNVSGTLTRLKEDEIVGSISTATDALAEIQRTKAQRRLARLGFSTLSVPYSSLQVGYAMGGLSASIDAETIVRDGALLDNSEILAKQQAVAVELFTKQQAALAESAENLYRRQVGLVGAAARIKA